ncbi:hypothetical protein ABTZ21_30900 [Streptomyces sp. NPDC096191]|uniref:hypothetical protein n=1 Tax=Streptomyces sp. NPDC096191 TaxID=3155426 RepID=UPI0033169B43
MEPELEPEEAEEEAGRPAAAEADAAEGALVEEAVPRPCRRGRRTALLICAAAVLGVVAGTCTGYLVQAHREPTKLPSLAQPLLAPAGGEAPKRLPASQDRRVRADGDLRELLLKKPRGTKDAEWLEGTDGWMDLAAYAETYERPGESFEGQLEHEFRRAAVTAWDGDSYSVEIRLVQFRQEEVLAAAEASEQAQYWVMQGPESDGWAIPGTGEGMAYVFEEPETEPGYEPVYTAEAHARRGDVVMEIWINGEKRIDKKMIMDLATRQMERL